MRGLRPQPRRDDGVTLVELLVVILIVGILAAIAIPSFLDQQSKAYDATAKEVARAASQAAETYETDHAGNYVRDQPGSAARIRCTRYRSPKATTTPT